MNPEMEKERRRSRGRRERRYVVDDRDTRERWLVTARVVDGAWREVGGVRLDWARQWEQEGRRNASERS